ncbi:uncharacterized protein LOC752781 isoform X2 [Strongylocentrotus purpuratus]|uniref:MARVEL domain-containing protein n=1 Tax=Strongylocentrotus purpuratus TaxID=7668 RepID=A0A7M7LW53_STRPU|nr:uncharacterized protein LOC752781 isoform X2 [Strongylocentrotus purpuratus]|eukprot:XP_011673682.1 PREDICTED: CKLF-like MARVEL transmembrane domain-containing protein 7 isoform X2 [Strongylocentrotus purpuratus]
MASFGEETKTSPDAEHVERKCGLDMSYVKSINGILKAKQIGWSLLAFTLACIEGSGISIVFFIIATLCGWTTTFVIWFMFSSHTYKKVTRINWFLADLVVSLAACVLYVCIGIPVIISPFCPLCIAAAVFGFIAAFSYGIGFWQAYRTYRSQTYVEV